MALTTVIANSIGASISGFKCVPTCEIRNKFFKIKRFEECLKNIFSIMLRDYQ